MKTQFCRSTRVDVLMATYNGAKYLPSQLDSILSQSQVRVRLIVGDDGSTDKTLDVIESYRNAFEEFELTRSNRLGPAKNFLSLLNQSSSEYVAFSDQDDIWLNNHLYDSINRIKSCQGPAITYSPTLTVDANSISRGEKKWPNFTITNELLYLTQNFARGCTIVMNSAARDLINSRVVSDVIMHDWWSLIVVAACGEVIQGQNVEVMYRIHDKNHTGLKHDLLSRTKRFFDKGFRSPSPIFLQIWELEKLYGDEMFDSFRELVRNLSSISQTRKTLTRIRRARVLPRLRYRCFEDIGLKAKLVLTGTD